MRVCFRKRDLNERGEKNDAEKWQVIKNEFLNLLKVVFKHFNARIIFLTLKKLALSLSRSKIQGDSCLV